MKTYVLTVSRKFPATHKRKGEQTYFREKIKEAISNEKTCSSCKGCDFEFDCPDWLTNTHIREKIHTIRSNYPFWQKRIKEIQAGKAILSLRYWSGKPYNSKQVEFAILDKDSGVGVQKLQLDDYLYSCLIDGVRNSFNGIPANDGLSIEDFEKWFKNYDLSKPMAIIHFTKFRY